MSKSFTLYRASIDRRHVQLHRVLSNVRALGMRDLQAVDFTGREYLDDATQLKVITRLHSLPGVYVWHRDDRIRCAGHTTISCWERIRTGFSHDYILPTTVLPTDSFVFYPCKTRLETIVLEIDLIEFFDPPFGRRRDHLDLRDYLLEERGVPVWRPKPNRRTRSSTRRVA